MFCGRVGIGSGDHSGGGVDCCGHGGGVGNGGGDD